MRELDYFFAEAFDDRMHAILIRDRQDLPKSARVRILAESFGPAQRHAWVENRERSFAGNHARVIADITPAPA